MIPLDAELASGLAYAGLTRPEILSYLALATEGEKGATAVARCVKIPRATAHVALENLVRMGFANKMGVAGHSSYRAEPSSQILASALEKKSRNDAQFNELTRCVERIRGFASALPAPKVRMYEGREGIRKVLFDSLTSKTTIQTLVNVDEMIGHFRTENEEYLAERVKNRVHKQAIVSNTPFGRKVASAYDTKATESRICKDPETRLRGETNIYDGKVSFVTYRDERPVGFIVEDPHYYEVQRNIFAALWEKNSVGTASERKSARPSRG